MKNKMNNMEKEKIPLLVVYKQDDKIYADQPDEKIDQFQLYGFLKSYTILMEEKLLETFEDIDE